MKSIIIAAALIACAGAIPIGESGDVSHYWFEFGKFVQQHGKSYSSVEEFSARFTVFRNWMDYIASHNAKVDKTYELAINKFADHTWKEFSDTCGTLALHHSSSTVALTRPPLCRYLGYRYQNRSRAYNHHIGGPAATAIDWRVKGCVNAVKDQVQSMLLVWFRCVYKVGWLTNCTGPMRFVLGILCRSLTRVRQFPEERQAARPLRTTNC